MDSFFKIMMKYAVFLKYETHSFNFQTIKLIITFCYVDHAQK